MFKVANYIQFVGWLTIFCMTVTKLLNSKNILSFYYGNPFETELFLLKIVQSIGVLDFVYSKGNLFSIFFQFIARMLCAFVILDIRLSTFSVGTVLIAWSLSDTIRYLYYNVNHPIIGHLRYNLFLINYPIGVFAGEIVAMSEFISLDNGVYSQYYRYFARLFQFGLVVGLPFLYYYLLLSRKQFYRIQQGGSTQQPTTSTQNVQTTGKSGEPVQTKSQKQKD